MGTITIELSSRERRHLFMAVREVYRDGGCMYADPERMDTLLDDLDDGGLWNPCDLRIPDKEEEQMLILYCLHMGIALGEGEHHLRNVKSRMKYIDSREDSTQNIPAQPIFSPENYYGPEWESKRQKAITRDSGECVDCGMSRERHMEKHGNDLEVHHLVPKSMHFTFKEANALDNLITLCRDCHLMRENPEPAEVQRKLNSTKSGIAE